MKIKEKPGVSATERDPRWALVVARDAKAEGQFVYAVRTTGIYCRPSCPSRLAKPENVCFYDTSAAAEAAGFRPCQRCRPTQRPRRVVHAETVAKLCRFIETAERVPTLDELSVQAGMSSYHLHRIFTGITGLTPRAYAVAYRAERVRKALDGGNSVTDAIYAAGYQSSGCFYGESNQVLGMTPTRYRAGGLSQNIHFAVAASSLGAILVAQSDKGICAIWLGDDPDLLVQELQERFPRANLLGGDQAFEQLVAQVVGFIEAPQLGLDLPLDIRGTAFQQRVWQALRDIPAGQTVSYTELAQRLGMPKAVRAVARACAANVLAVAIPCHRVVRIGGDLAGYRWGIERKRELIQRESMK